MRRGFIAREALVSAVCVLPLAVLIALLSTGVMSRGMLSLLGSVAWAQLGVWTDGGSFLYPTNNEDVIVGASSEANADHLLKVSGSAIFNEQGADADCRIEGDSDNELLCTDASTDRVGIGANDPTCKLDVRKSGGSVLTTNSVLAVQNNADSTDSCDVNILGGATGTTRVCFGDTTNPAIAEWYTDSASGQSAIKADTIYIEGGQKVKRTAVTGNYTAASSDYYLGVNAPGGGLTVTLPSAATAGAGKTYVIKDEGGNASTRNIGITSSSGNIDGNGTETITTNYGSRTVVSNGTNWFITSKV